MQKYNIEGGIDFYNELYKSDYNEEIIDQDNICLITNEPLTEKFVTLQCGHKFNYIPLYYDIVNHKKKFNQMEGPTSKLSLNEIRCPYCRKKQEYLLDYYEVLGLEKVNGVNFYDPSVYESIQLHYNKTHKCEYKWKNENYDPSKPETNANSKYLIYKLCNCPGTQINIYNVLDPSQPINYGDSKYYCYTHKKDMIKQYKLQQKEKEKLEKKQAKVLEKQMKLLEKENINTKKKEEKQKNIVLEPLNIGNESGCIQILKTGLNKGHQCGCKIISENLCKRHHTLNHNK